jgi:hypothetical protein
MNELNYWRKCTTCKNLISFGQKYWICSVSTCNRVRTDLVFCDLRCFDAHVPVLNHRDAGAFERKAPLSHETSSAAQTSPAPAPPKQIPQTQASPSHSLLHSDGSDHDILVVVSKIKKYIKDQSGLSTSDSVMTVLSHKVRDLADHGIKTAYQQARKTVMERDF